MGPTNQQKIDLLLSLLTDSYLNPIEALEKAANQVNDGHFILLKFTTNFKCSLNCTMDLDYEEIQKLPTHQSLAGVVNLAILEKIKELNIKQNTHSVEG